MRLFALLITLTALACTRDAPENTAAIEISSPEEGALVNTAQVRIRGSAQNVKRVEIGTVSAEVVGGEWEALVPVDQGENTLTVRATEPDAQDSVTFTVDSRPPQLQVTSPERALYRTAQTGDTVTVAGTVSDDGTGLEIIKVREQILTPDANGNWSYELALQPGLNEIAVTARDVAGNEAENIRAVMFGDYIGATDTIEPAFNIWIDDDSLPTVETVIENFVTPENVLVLLAQYLQNDSIDIESLAFDPIDFNVTLRRHIVDLEVIATNVVMQGIFQIGGDPTPVTVELRRFRLAIEANPVVLDDGGLDVSFSNVQLELAPEDLTYNIGDLYAEDSQFLEDQIIYVAEAGFGYALSQGLFDQLYDPDILKRKLAVLGREIVFELSLVLVDVFPDGILLKTTMDLPTERWPDVRSDTPGALHRAPGPATAATTVAPVQFTVTRNALDRILNGVWYSGLLHQEIVGAQFGEITLPFALNAGSLAAVIDSSIGGLAPPSTPGGLRLRPMFPPVAEYDVDNKRLLIQVAELMIDVLLYPPGEAPLVVATVATFLDLSARLDVEGVKVKLTFDTELRADVTGESIADLDEAKTEEALESLIALIPTLVAQELEIEGEADVTWVTLKQPTIDVHGANLDFATVSLQMEPNTIELPEPQPTDGM